MQAKTSPDHSQAGQGSTLLAPFLRSCPFLGGWQENPCGACGQVGRCRKSQFSKKEKANNQLVAHLVLV